MPAVRQDGQRNFVSWQSNSNRFNITLGMENRIVAERATAVFGELFVGAIRGSYSILQIYCTLLLGSVKRDG